MFFRSEIKTYVNCNGRNICFKLDSNCFQQKGIWKHHEQIEGSKKIAAANNITNPWSAAENKGASPIEFFLQKATAAWSGGMCGKHMFLNEH